MTLPEVISVLVIDDDEEDYLIISDLLSDDRRKCDYDITWVSSYDEACRVLDQHEFSICLVDYRLGGNNGLELLRHSKIASRRLPAIILTGFDSREAEGDAMLAGAFDYIEKNGMTSRLLERSIRYSLLHAWHERELRHSRERYAIAAAGSNDGLWDWDLHDNSIYFSERWLDMLGYVEDPFMRSPDKWFEQVHQDDLDALTQAIGKHLEGKTAYIKQSYRMRHCDGRYLWMLCRGKAVFDSQGKPYRVAGSQTDISEDKEREKQLAHDALHDALTGLSNKLMLIESLKKSLARMNRNQAGYSAILFMDVDDFKGVNDSFGHELGDRLLVKMARRLKVTTRESDMVARFGGDEFVVLLTDLDGIDSALILTERIADSLNDVFKFGDKELFISTSIGVVLVSPTDHRRIDEILRDADTALYDAKASGKACYSVFNDDMRARTLRHMRIKMELKRAISRNQLKLHYQPIYSFNDFRTVGFEALIRWDYSGSGLISPAEFIPIAEETGLIIPIGQWIFNQACRQMQQWQTLYPDMKDLYVSVNLSPRQLKAPSLADNFYEVITEAGLSPSQVRLEITETSVMSNNEQARVHLSRLHSMGFKICMDDFGSGYSSLSMLHEFPVDVLKIDQAFIRRLHPGDPASQQMVSSILAMAHALDMCVVAEGIETDYQQELLCQLGCECGQGYLYSKPLEVSAAIEFIRAHCAAA